MSDEIKVSSSAVSARPAAEPRSASKLPWIILGVVVVVVIVLGVLFRDKLFPSKTQSTATATTKSEYQAVFLTNGQVYFGKISGTSADYVTLKDIFYLQVTQTPMQGSAQDQQQAQTQEQPQISLVKLGNELHGPVDEMHINQGQVLFYEDLKEEGQVVKAIKDYKANPQGQQQPAK